MYLSSDSNVSSLKINKIDEDATNDSLSSSNDSLYDTEFDINFCNKEDARINKFSGKNQFIVTDTAKKSSLYGSLTGSISINKGYEFDENVFCVKATPDDLYWAVGLQNGKISFVPVNDEKNLKSVNSLKLSKENTPVTDMEFISFKSDSEKRYFLLAVYASGFIRLWHFYNPNVRSRLIREWMETYFDENVNIAPKNDNVRLNQILCVSVSGDLQRFVTGGDDHTIKVYEITSKVVSRILHKGERTFIHTGRAMETATNADFHSMRITAVKYHPLGKHDANYSHVFVSGSWDNTIHIWDDRKEGSLWQYLGPHVCGSDAIDIDPLTNTIVSCSWRRDKAVIQIWRFNTYIFTTSTIIEKSIADLYTSPQSEYYQDMTQIPSQGYVAQFLLNGQLIMLGGSNYNLFKIVDVNSFQLQGAVFDMRKAVVTATSVEVDKKKIKLALGTGKSIIILELKTVRK